MIKKLGWLLSLFLFLLTSCGGGSNVASNGVGSGGTGSYTSGPVSGLGSIIVNGVRYDVSSASVQDDEDSVGLGQANLQLGMLVEVQGSAITAGGSGQTDTATATSVKVTSDFIGKVTSVTTSGSTITGIAVLGRNVQIDSKTVFSAAIAPNDYVSVYGLVSASGYTATRIDKLSSAPALYKASGVVQHLNKSLKQFDLGGVSFDYGSVLAVPSSLRDGALVRVWWTPFLSLTNPIPLQKLRMASAAVANSTAARFRGLIGEFTDQKHFVVNGVAVDASALNLSGLAEGSRLVIKGKMVNGVLVATEVSAETQTEIDAREVELHGRASAIGSSQLTVRGVVVSFDSSVLHDGPVTSNQCIEVRGTSFNASNQLVATVIEADTSCVP